MMENQSLRESACVISRYRQMPEKTPDQYKPTCYIQQLYSSAALLRMLELYRTISLFNSFLSVSPKIIFKSRFSTDS
jgi:hypothetical protein